MRNKLTNAWFFSEVNPIFYLLLIFIKGDMIILLPLTFLIGLSYFLSIKIGLILTGVYVVIRFSGEMFYWIMQQFGDRKYKPNDFGFSNLDNHAVYILYQTFAIGGVILGIAMISLSLLIL